MTKRKPSALDPLLEKEQTKMASNILRVAQYFTPWNFEPEQCDFNVAKERLQRLTTFDQVLSLFPDASDKLRVGLKNLMENVSEQQTTINAFESAGAVSALTNEQLFQEAVNNLPHNRRAAQQIAAAGV